MWRTALIVFIASLGLLQAQVEPVYYVAPAPAGDDRAGGGTPERPWATISFAVTKLPETGGTILVRDGLYQGNVRISRKFRALAWIRAEHPYRARLRNNSSQTLSIWDAANVVFTGFDVSKSTYPTAVPLCSQIARSENIILADNIFHDSLNNDILKINDSPRNLLIIGNVFYNQQGAAGQHIDVNGATDVTIRDNIFFNDYSDSPYDGKDTHGFIVVKNSGEVPEARRTQISSNVFLNWVGGVGSNFVLFGEDGLPFYEYQDAVVENNLMIGNSAERMRSPFSSKGAKDVVFRNNTITGDLPSSAYAVRFTRGGPGVMNKNFQLLNNIWSDPSGTMGNFADGFREEAVSLVIDNNLYWNGGEPIPIGQTPDKDSVQYTDDARALVADPKLPPIGKVLLPRWTGESFPSGSKTIRQEFERLVMLYGIPAPGSAAIGRAVPEQSPETDILDRNRGPQTDLGAVQANASPAALRVVPVPARLVGGASSVLSQVVLEKPAGPGGETVFLTSSDPALVSVPDSVYASAGLSFAPFPLATSRVESLTTVRLTVRRGEQTKEVSVTLMPEGLRSHNLGPETLTAGFTSSRNLVLLDGVAGPEGAAVSLSSSRPDLVIVPDSVAVEPGKAFSAYFPITTRFAPEKVTVTLTATLGSSSTQAELSLLPPQFQLALQGDTFAGESYFTGHRIILHSPPPEGGGSVSLSSTLPGILLLPESLPVPEGAVVVDLAFHTGPTAEKIRGVITATYLGRTASAACFVNPMSPYSLTVPASIPGGTAASVTLTMSGGPSADLPVEISVLLEEPLIVPDIVVVPAGHHTVSFKVTAKPVASSARVTLSASYSGRAISKEVVIDAPQLNTIAFSYPRTTGGSPSTNNTVSLRGPAPEGGMSIALSSSAPSIASVPESVTVPAGASSARFEIKSVPVPDVLTVIISATCCGATKTAVLTVAPPALAALSVGPNPLTGGGASKSNRVTLNGFAPPGGMMVRLSSSHPDIASVPESVTVPAGGTSQTFEITSVPTRDPVTVTFSASAGGVTKTATLTVAPPRITVLVLYPSSIVGGNSSPASSVVLNGPALPGGVTVTFTSSDPNAVPRPDPVTIPEGQSGARFAYTTNPVAAAATVTITGTDASGFAKSATLTVLPR